MTRLYHPDTLYEGHVLTLNDAQSHYLRHVLRATLGHKLFLFNENDGEWSASLTTLSKATTCVTVAAQIRPAISSPVVSLLFAPLKHDPLSFLIEKATELGVRQFYPVVTERCNVSRVNTERLKSNVIAAAQQCERFDIPTIYPVGTLRKALESWETPIPLFVCQERGEVPSLKDAFYSLTPRSPAGFLIGPEGGFAPSELAYLKSFSFTHFISLGPRILRAETAALAAIACYQALVGDWEDVSMVISPLGEA
jgi:16S rRNA (uracil1498-N3)-methyltransferase